ncbi:MAG: hypothetical protein PeribacterA2_0812 [Candidatus Peribacter riflensis]|uniref:Uncharacterized protein n=1 Tax=Candidatus Peribacter riflensis TaxID=1735162 RepID=A0A0S1SIR2_9BACT|nr:MAG: hypothetical protein PeribacterA2_0812 [Candidatus Peribacter riflensis]OGJ77670.1 MAG: hypothetical protein A2398_04310 [Candidatus Peribacteria bacterium RIFOXYB1_FULL_57_12]OGJ78550.1 MAG: hypothetical protein A2412_03130 [Candidatus Peribacteria bacterium RIFOXYC1_FULL_58_8]ALM11278.1 MAG: hypothetical protein PeribacterB2_0814 [Candidatus Peribacter riflensis]ALM12380.1 MAG: hypothetical protein PeribacterC2_0813 [Candidatus Peribacter riflensis]
MPLRPALCLLAGSSKASDPTRRRALLLQQCRAFPFTPHVAPLPRFLFLFLFFLFCFSVFSKMEWINEDAYNARDVPFSS